MPQFHVARQLEEIAASIDAESPTSEVSTDFLLNLIELAANLSRQTVILRMQVEFLEQQYDSDGDLRR